MRYKVCYSHGSNTRLSLSLKRPATHLQKPPQQFVPLTSEEDFRCAAKGVIPLNIKSLNEWALQNLPQSAQLDRECIYYYFKEGDILFHNGELFSFAVSSLFMVHKASSSADDKCAKNFKPNSANRIQGLNSVFP